MMYFFFFFFFMYFFYSISIVGINSENNFLPRRALCRLTDRVSTVEQE
jgi:hypothetical protein